MRDYLDVAALSGRYRVADAADVLLDLDAYYEDQHTAAGGDEGGVRSQLVRQLADPRPRDTSVLAELPSSKQLDRRWHDWNDVRARCVDLADAMLSRSV